MKKKWWIVIICIIILIVAVTAVYFIFLKGSSFSFGIFDFSAGTNAFSNIGEVANANAFENIKLNPFANSTG